ncbi:hypothetical protein niasHS_012690 [Heterodera schachtii]|uniref:Uncharacterized protein n=1 Tax=Heterodera schachtii TaxID=97005 RepID=A0ABD2IG44_HETSC
MAQIVNLVSFLTLVLSWPNALSIDTDAVKEMATQFSSLTSSTWDTVNQLKFVSENAMEFVRAAGAVGPIIATAVDTAFSEITWPTISRFYAKSAIGNLPINESKEDYQFVAEKIKEELGQFGAAEYDYTVIVFPNWTDPEAMAIISEANSYIELIDVKQINVIIVRIEDNKTNFELACKAAEWFTPTIETKMKEAIK